MKTVKIGNHISVPPYLSLTASRAYLRSRPGILPAKPENLLDFGSDEQYQCECSLWPILWPVFSKGGDTDYISALTAIKKASKIRPIYSDIHTLSVNLF
jgi:hypothetical protein